MLAQDFQIDDTGDLLIQDGDFVIDLSDNDHVEDIIISAPGDWKQFPLVGVNISQYNKSTQQQELQSAINLQLQSDGYNDIQLSPSLDANGKYLLSVIAERQ